MATYNSSQLKGKGVFIEALTSGSTYTFTLVSPLLSSTYFTLETIRNTVGYYDSISLPTAGGIFENLNNIKGLVSSSYIFSVVVESGGGSFDFTPLNNIPISGSYLRGTGDISLSIS